MKNQLKKLMNADSIFGAIILAISICFYFLGSAFSNETTDGTVGEGYFPQLIAAAVAILAISVIITAAKKGVKYFQMNEERKKSIKPFLITLGLLFLYIVSWNFVHFIIKTELFLLGMCYVLKMSKKFSIIFSTAFSVGIYFLFTELFSILL